MATDDDNAIFPAYGAIYHGWMARGSVAWVVALGAAVAVVGGMVSASTAAVWGVIFATYVVTFFRGPKASLGWLSVGKSVIRWVDIRGVVWERSRAALVAGWREGSRAVFSFVGGGALVLDVGDEDAARRCLDAAGVGAGQRAVVFEMRSAWLRLLWLFGAFAMGFLALTLALAAVIAFMVFPAAGMMMLPLLALLVLATVMLRRPTESLDVRVGADGVAVCGDRGERFIRYADIVKVEENPSGVVLCLREGTTVTVHGPALGAWPRRALATRVRDAFAAYRLSAAAERTRELPVLREAPFDDWRDALRGRRGAVYRSHALSRDDLATVVVDPAASPEQRVAAALALTGDDDVGDGRTRVRVAADATASAALRGAFERVLDDTLDEGAWRRFEHAARRS